MDFPNLVHLLSAIAAAIAAGVAAIPIFIPELNSLLSINAYTWAPVWAMTIIELDVRVSLSAATRSILAAWFASGAGILCFYLATLIFDADLYKQHAIALVLMIPFTSIIRMSYPDTQSFLTHVFRWDVGLICAYTVAGFGKSTTTWIGTSIAIGFTIGSIIALLLAVLNRILRPSARRARLLSAAIVKFRITHTVWLEGLVDCMHDSTKHHHQELSRRQDDANEAFRELQSLIRLIRGDFVNQLNDPSTLNALYRASSTINVTLFAIRGAMSHDALVCEPVNRIFNADMKALIQSTKLDMATMLLPNGHNTSSSSMKPILLPTPLFGDTIQTIIEEEELTRFLFMITCINGFQDSIRNFVSIVDKFNNAEIFFLPRHKSISQHILKLLNNARGTFVPKTGWKFFIKGTITNEILAQGLVALQYQFPQYDIAPYFGWAVVGYIVTFLPTCGEAIVRGSRRAVGTLVGSGFTAIIAVSGDIHAMSAFFILIIIVFIGKLVSYHPFVSYAGIVFALCQLFEILPQMVYEKGRLEIASGSDLLFVVLYRTICMCIGVGYSLISTILIYPYYSSDRVRQIFSKSVTTIADVLEKRFHRHGESSHDQGLSDIDLVDLSSVFGIQRPLPEACARAHAELFILSRQKVNKVPFRLPNIIKAEGALYRLSSTTFIVSLIMSYSSQKTTESIPIWDLIHELVSEFKRCASRFSHMIEFPAKSESALPRECIFDWSSKVAEIYSLIRSLDDAPLHNLVFALTEFLSAWDEFVKKVDPKLIFTSSRALSGIGSGQSVRLSLEATPH